MPRGPEPQDGLARDAARWRRVFEEFPFGIAIYRPDGVMKQGNPHMAELFGVSEEVHRQLIGHYNILDDEQHERNGVASTIRRAFEGETVSLPIMRYVVPATPGVEERTTWVQGSLRPMRDAQGKILEVVLLMQDVSEIEEARRRLDTQRQVLSRQLAEVEHFYDTSPVGLCLMDADLKFVRINDTLARINGRPKAAHLGRTLREALPEMADRLEPLYRRVLETGEPALNVQIVGRTRADPDRERTWMSSYHPIETPEGRIWGVDTIVQEITTLKQAEEALRQSEEHLRTIINHAPAIIWSIDADGRFTLSEGRALKTLGLRPGEVVGQSLFEFYADHPQIVGDARRALAGETVKSRTTVDGVIFENRHTPRLDGDGNVVGAFGVAIDVTERERAAEERRQLESQMQEAQRLESLGVLAGGIAHDFNNLLMGVLGNADLALARIPPGTPGRDLVEHIETTAQRAAELTNQMLAYSGKGRFVVEPLQLNRIVEEMGDLLRTVISKKATLRFDLESDLPAVEADASQLRQVVMNLITNASEALEGSSGTIVVHTASLVADRRHVRGYGLDADLKEGPHVVLRVSDTGVGMDADTRRRIFDPFFTTKFAGRGLGLAGVLGIVRGHRGAIRVESHPGGGSSFEVLLPATDRPVRGSPSPLPSKPSFGAAATILVVDDDEMVAEVAQAMLEEAGFTVLVARDGQEAVDLYHHRSDEIAVVLLDMTMPRLSGEEAFQQMRRIRPDVQVILSSGYSEQEARDRFAGQGLAGFVQKPYRAADLMAHIHGALRG